MKTKIQIVSISGSVLFEHEAEDNTVKDTLIEAVKGEANLRGADLYGADLYGANLREADLREADLRGANLYGADLYGANLREADLREADLREANLYGADLYGANLREADLREADLREADLYGADLYGANLRGIDFEKLPIDYINLCSRDMLFIFAHLKDELPYLREKLVKGEVDGSQYEGECACLIGSLGKSKGSIDKVCKAIPYYDKGLHNPGEQWFLHIREGDTPKNNVFAKHALELIDSVLKEK